MLPISLYKLSQKGHGLDHVTFLQIGAYRLSVE